jgi:sulfane dehydrogenase subunit SoxC
VVRRTRIPPAIPAVASSLTPLADMHGIITPGGLHYERHHAGVPSIDPRLHRLLVHGLVDNPLLFTMDDLLRMPSVSRICFLECSGNTPLWKSVPETWTVQTTHGLLSCSEWTGVKVSDILERTGIKPSAKWALAEGADAAAMTRSIPMDALLSEAIIAYAQNGERLRPEQGYPIRLLMPGFEGNTSIKWLRRLKLGTDPWQTREETSKYTDLVPGGRARQFAFVMEVKSVITSPSGGQSVKLGAQEIRGLAWSGRGCITRVEVSTTGGQSWQDATLQTPILPKCLTRFRSPWQWEGQPGLLLSRATDETGFIQPTREMLLADRGGNSRYHYNAIHGWRLGHEGAVVNAG